MVVAVGPSLAVGGERKMASEHLQLRGPREMTIEARRGTTRQDSESKSKELVECRGLGARRRAGRRKQKSNTTKLV